MGKIGLYFDHYIEKIGLHLGHFMREGGIILYITILLAMILMVWYVWQKIKIKKVQDDFLLHRAFED